MKIVYSDRKTGRSGQADVPNEKVPLLIGKEIGDTIEGSIIGMDGYTLQITGLTDASGTPSRKEIEGSRKVYAYLLAKKRKKGLRVRRLVRGRAIAQDTQQINTVIVNYGPTPVESFFKPKESKEAENK